MIFNDHRSSSSSSSSSAAAAAAANSSQCLTLKQLEHRAEKLRLEWTDHRDSKSPSLNAWTCLEAAKEMRGDMNRRAVSPWRYRKDQDDNRLPSVIYVAECLCKGCIINQRENSSYNSVLVNVSRKILRKTPCPSDSNKYRVKTDFISLPVACVCVVPKFAK